MSFTRSQFEFCIRHFESVSNEIHDEWCTSQSLGSETYLKKVSLSSHIFQSLSRIVSWEYHVVYSYSYLMPVLYFNVCFEDGKLLSLDHVEILIDPIFRTQFEENKWSYLSQQEHPYLRRPFFMLHPCSTENFMKPFLSNLSHINPLVTWLSSIAPVINLNIDPRYSLHFNPHKFKSLV